MRERNYAPSNNAALRLYTIIDEVKCHIVKNILDDLNNYDGNFNSGIQSIGEILSIIMKSNPSEGFMDDYRDMMSEDSDKIYKIRNILKSGEIFADKVAAIEEIVNG